MTGPSISLLLPTRGRAALVERLFSSIVETSVRLDRIEVVLYVDDDDTGSHQLASEQFAVTRIVGPRLSMGQYNSACLARARGDIIVLANDDMVIRTRGWDERLVQTDAAFADRIYLAYCNDFFKPRRCTFPVLSRRTCELLVEPYPADYQGAFIDTHLFDLFKRLEQAGHRRIRYLDDVIFEHLHFRTGKAERDATYLRRGRFADDSIFIGMATVRAAGALRLLNALKGAPLPEYRRPPACDYAPAGLYGAVMHLSRHVLLDRQLPLRWRIYVWYRFVGRYIASRRIFRRFVLQ